MIDAGSTGSRVHIYKFNNCKVNPTYEYEVFKMTQPGLSSFADSPDKAAASLDVLLDEAMRVIPEEFRKCAPVEVKATAGLRLLGEEKSEAILAKVKERLQRNYPFAFGSAEVMDRKDKGAYAWITCSPSSPYSIQTDQEPEQRKSLVPVRTFVQEVLKRSKTTGSVLQTALRCSGAR